MPLKRPNARMLARVSVRTAIDNYYLERTLDARDEALRDLEVDLVLVGELPLSLAMNLTAAENDDSDYYEFSRVDPREYPYSPKSISCRE